MRSSRFPIKSMLMGVVGQSQPDKHFDGGILLERVSKTHIIKKQHIHALVMMLSSILR